MKDISVYDPDVVVVFESFWPEADDDIDELKRYADELIDALREFHMAKDCNLRFGRNGNRGEYAIIGDGRFRKYTTTVDSMRLACDFFKKGWLRANSKTRIT